ncbi:hypothetical protein BFW88_18805 [Pseudomonas fluorescens]|nr:hypothetical protein BFW88_18805 [Pseudomonas fluorescens]OPB07007.1 hypothetical protein BFW92_18755 [Pseudomonas fluorescens]OPB18323.1 hypothetical protein BFW93_18780 [Pseudomonas fluorescens]
MQESKHPRGLRGWLILIGIGLVLTVARFSYSVIAVYYPIFTDGSFTALTTPGTHLYNALWAPFLISEALYNSIMGSFSIYLTYLFFTKHYLFPRLYIAALVAWAVFVPLDAWVSSFVLVNEPIFDYDTTKEMIRVLIGVFVWVPYILVSKRVKATFVKHRPVVANTRGNAAV